MPELQNQSISQRTKVLIERLLLGRFTLAQVAKITGLSEQWLEAYVHASSILKPHQVLF